LTEPESVLRLIHWLLLSLLLIAAGLGIAAYKSQVLGYPVQPGQVEPTWTVQARAQITPSTGPVKVSLLLPTATPGMGQLRENFISRGYGLTTQSGSAGREAIWAVRRASQSQALYAVASGQGLGPYLSARGSCPGARWGYPCFRDGTVPIVVLFTDAPFNNGPSPQYAYAFHHPSPGYTSVSGNQLQASAHDLGNVTNAWRTVTGHIPEELRYH
jgi:hypothetical protein